MVVRRRKKITRQRGSRTHGWGLVHRGSGNRGGVGNAGTGKKAHCKKPSVWKEDHLGKFGFTKHGTTTHDRIISLKQIAQQLNPWQAKKLAAQDKDTITIDLTKMGYTKLLSTGKVTKKLNITVAIATADAIEKVKAAGGTITTTP
ncbi:uL15 family ribosomal protein [Candidatus Woesearchaeota archaeon]|nr:uL15 family ribosomal protein [Candidatus Woesearchaeota archaeon]